MPFDAHKNLAIATVTTATGAAGTTLGVGAGEGARFPAVPFNATVWPVDMAPDPTTAEVVRVTARTGDSLTITRAQEGTTARAIVVGDFVAETITAKALSDIESGTNFPLITTPGTVTTPQLASAAATALALAPAGTVRGTLHPSGGFSWGGTTDPGAGNLSVQGGRVYLNGSVGPQTNDGADAGTAHLIGGGAAADSTRGASISVHGNEAGLAGSMQIMAGDAAGGGNVYIYTAATALRGMIHRSGGFSWGGTTDPGAGVFGVGDSNPAYPGRIKIGFNGVTHNGLSLNDSSNTNGINYVLFAGVDTPVGSISRAGAGVAYNTTSDARLKTPLSRHTDPEVLRNTVIHNFVWKSDGTAGRGVFAQEAHSVLPCAVSVGTDDVDAEGRLTHPWGVDYSKYVPDLITGWQAHDADIHAHETDILELRGLVTALAQRRDHADRPTWAGLYKRVRNFINGLWPAWITP